MTEILLKNFALLDVHAGALRSGFEVLVRGREIAAVEEGAIAAPEAEVVDLGGRTLMPGLIDCHVHAIAPVIGSGKSGYPTKLPSLVHAGAGRGAAPNPDARLHHGPRLRRRRFGSQAGGGPRPVHGPPDVRFGQGAQPDRRPRRFPKPRRLDRSLRVRASRHTVMPRRRRRRRRAEGGPRRAPPRRRPDQDHGRRRRGLGRRSHRPRPVR